MFVGQFFFDDQPVVRQDNLCAHEADANQDSKRLLGAVALKTTFPSSETRLPGGARRLAISALALLRFLVVFFVKAKLGGRRPPSFQCSCRAGS